MQEFKCLVPQEIGQLNFEQTKYQYTLVSQQWPNEITAGIVMYSQFIEIDFLCRFELYTEPIYL